MTKTNREFRSDLAKEMRDKRKERDEQLKQIDKLPLSEPVKESAKKDIMEAFYKQMEEFKNRPWYEEARKTHFEESKAKLKLNKVRLGKDKLQKEYEEKMEKINKDILVSENEYKGSKIANEWTAEQKKEKFKAMREKWKKYSYEDWKSGDIELQEWDSLILQKKDLYDEDAEKIAKLELKKGVSFKLGWNRIWDEWAKAIAWMKLQEWVSLSLSVNRIWDEWAKAIAGMDLKECVKLDLSANQIWDEWVKSIAWMELKEWVELVLAFNHIWDEWAKIIMKNIELKDGVVLFLQWNNISWEVKEQLKEWAQSYKDKWIECMLIV